MIGIGHPGGTVRGLLRGVRGGVLVAGFALSTIGCGRSDAPDGGTATDERPATPAAAPVADGHERMIARLRAAAERVPAENMYLGDGELPAIEAALGELPADRAPAERSRLLVLRALERLRLGHEAEAIADCTTAVQILEDNRAPHDQWTLNEVRAALGLCHLRQGETQNCCNRNTADSCILPIRGEGIHVDRRASERAVRCFLDAIAGTTPGSRQHHRIRWLLNIAAMTLDEYPDGVPDAYRIPPFAFASDEPFPRFLNVASEAGVDTFGQCGGAIADDFDGDGRLDLIVSDYHPAAPLRYFRNSGTIRFVERTAEAGLTGITGGLNLVQADYDNDGALDVLVLRGGWFGAAGRHPNSLLRNDGTGTFTDVTYAAGLGGAEYPTQTASWGDFDLDGDLDLYVGNEDSDAVPAPCQLFRNDGDGTFTDVAASAGVTNDGFTKAVVWGDYDGDRWPDLYVSNLDGANRLYRNEGDGTFTDVAPQLGVTEPLASFPAWFWDFDNDGRLDIMAHAYSAHVAEVAASMTGAPLPGERARLYRNTGAGFEDVAERMGVAGAAAPMGSNFGDLDGDGFLDFSLGTGRPPYRSLMPNVMYRNRGGTGFADVTTAGGFGHLQKGHAVVFADLDHDGDQDVFEQMGGAWPGDKYYDVLYENPGFGNEWIVVKLVGTTSSRCAIGARIRVELVDDAGRRSIYRHVNSGGSFGANPLRQHIGLGRSAVIDTLEVFWPVTGVTQRFRNVAAGQTVEITEGDDTVRTVDR